MWHISWLKNKLIDQFCCMGLSPVIPCFFTEDSITTSKG